jgi:homoserine/homoserine lactone efflux protein
MMTQSLLLFAAAEFIFCLTPGPAVFLTLSQSIRYGLIAGVVVAAGVVTTNIFYFILSAFGVGAALASSPEVFAFLKYCGAAYLAYTAFDVFRTMWKSSMSDISSSAPPAPLRARTLRGGFLQAVLMQASNVKNIVIFIAIIPQFIDPNESTLWQFAALGAVSVLVELPVLAGYAALAAKLANFVKSNGYQNYLDGLSAVVLLGIAGTLALK